MAGSGDGNVRKAVESSFCALLAEKPFRSITVSDICQKAHLSRKAFYNYYCNKGDIVASIFQRDVIKPLNDFNSLFARHEIQNMGPLIYIKMYQSIYENKGFYRNLVRPTGTGAEAFVRAATDAIYRYDLPLIEALGVTSDPQEADYIAFFFASSQAMLMRKWISDGMQMSVEDLASLYLRMTENFWIQYSR